MLLLPLGDASVNYLNRFRRRYFIVAYSVIVHENLFLCSKALPFTMGDSRQV